jgi:hypothetical protein
VASATAVVFFGVGLNIFVTETLGAFGAASVLLALYLAFWSYVLGIVILFLLVFVNSPDGETQSHAAHARLRGCRTEKVKFGKKAERPLMV